MKIAVVYCYPLLKMRTYFPLAQRFASTYAKFPAGIEHDLHIGCNGIASHELDKTPFAGVKCQFHLRDNSGWDIGLFQWAAEHIPCDLLVCLGAPVHFYREGWLKRMADAFVDNGPNLYGCFGYTFPLHIRTTVFWCHPDLLNSYPYIIGSTRKTRYEFEHGGESFTRWVINAKLEAMIVSWNEVWPQPDWGKAKMGIGDCLCLDQFTHR